jgi:hypothetical protein
MPCCCSSGGLRPLPCAYVPASGVVARVSPLSYVQTSWQMVISTRCAGCSSSLPVLTASVLWLQAPSRQHCRRVGHECRVASMGCAAPHQHTGGGGGPVVEAPALTCTVSLKQGTHRNSCSISSATTRDAHCSIPADIPHHQVHGGPWWWRYELLLSSACTGGQHQLGAICCSSSPREGQALPGVAHRFQADGGLQQGPAPVAGGGVRREVPAGCW